MQSLHAVFKVSLVVLLLLDWKDHEKYEKHTSRGHVFFLIASIYTLILLFTSLVYNSVTVPLDTDL